MQAAPGSPVTAAARQCLWSAARVRCEQCWHVQIATAERTNAHEQEGTLAARKPLLSSFTTALPLMIVSGKLWWSAYQHVAD